MLLSSEGSFFPQLAGALPPRRCGSGEAASAGRGGFARPAASVLSVSGQVRHPRAAQPVPEMTSLPLRVTVASPQTPGFPAALARGWLLSRRRTPCREPRGLRVRGLRVHVASACVASACVALTRQVPGRSGLHAAGTDESRPSLQRVLAGPLCLVGKTIPSCSWHTSLAVAQHAGASGRGRGGRAWDPGVAAGLRAPTTPLHVARGLQ